MRPVLVHEEPPILYILDSILRLPMKSVEFVKSFESLECKCPLFRKAEGSVCLKSGKLDIARNLGSVQQLAGAWSSLETRPEMGDGRLSLSGFRVKGTEEEVICPKPRRPSTMLCPVNEYLKPSRRRRSQAAVRAEGDAGFELLDIFLSKGGYGDLSSFGCSPPYFSGSPPSRSGNPLIHDVEFLQQRAQSVLSHHISRVPASFVGNPVVRVEGFVSAGPDSRSRVSTLS